jgi:hypothetical protein
MEFKMKTPLVEKLEERGDPISLMAAREIKSLRLALINLSGADHLSEPLRNFIEEALGWSEKQDALARAELSEEERAKEREELFAWMRRSLESREFAGPSRA